MPRTITHVAIARACDADPEGPHIQMRAQHYGEPPQADLDTYRKTVEEAYERFFEATPARVGVAVLPFVAEEDDPDAE